MARSARCSAAVPDDTALAYAAPTRAANASSKAVTRGPSDSWPERRTSSTACSSASPRTGRASGMWSRTGFTRAQRGRAPGGRAGWSRRSRGGHAPGGAALMMHAPGQEAGLQRVDQGLPAGLDHVLRDADRTPGVGPVGGVQQHPRHGARRLGLVEDADLVVDQLDVGEVRIRLGDRRSQRGVERVDRAVALRGLDVALALDPDLDRGLGLDPAVLALLGHDPPRLELEERLVLAGLAPDQQVEGAVGGLELEAAVLEVLDALDDPAGGGVVELDAGLLRAREHGAAARELGDQHLARVADRGGVDVLEGRGVGVDAGDVQAALVREGVLAHVGLVGVRDEVEQLVEEVRRLRQAGERGEALVAHLELEVGDDRDEVGVAAALAVAVHR